ncbi:MAG: dUTP diphosphatase [Butyricicoccaceae bacterium]
MKTIRFRRIATAGGKLPALPAHATVGAAGADLRANLDAPLTVLPHQRVIVPTGLAIELPSAELGAFLFARSGLATKRGLALANGVGVIDSDYRGEIGVGMVNLSDDPYVIQPDERIAQLCIMPVCQFEAVEAQELGDTERGAGGFGSTGV